MLTMLLALSVGACSGGDAKKKNIDAKIAEYCLNGDFSAPGFASGIVGGKVVGPESWLSHEVFALVQQIGDGVAVCTATLLSQDVVLTAAHCVDEAGPENTFAVFSNQPVCDAVRAGKKVQRTPVALIRSHPNYQGEKTSGPSNPKKSTGFRGNGDLALVRLAAPAPKNFHPVRLIQTPVMWADVGSYVLAGFGWSSPSGRDNDNLLLRATVVPPLSRAQIAGARASASRQELKNLDNLIQLGADSEMIFFDQTHGQGLCHGDSGGPAFVTIDGKVFRMGVASAVKQGDSSKECQVLGLSTNVYFHRAWLEQTFDELGGGSRHRSLFR